MNYLNGRKERCREWRKPLYYQVLNVRFVGKELCNRGPVQLIGDWFARLADWKVG